MTKSKDLNPGSSKGPDPMATAIVMVSHLFEQVNRQIEANARAIAELGGKIGRLVSGIAAQKESIDRMERAVRDMIAGINAQTDAINKQASRVDKFLENSREQNRIVNRDLDLVQSAAAGRTS